MKTLRETDRTRLKTTFHEHAATAIGEQPRRNALGDRLLPGVEETWSARVRRGDYTLRNNNRGRAARVCISEALNRASYNALTGGGRGGGGK